MGLKTQEHTKYRWYRDDLVEKALRACKLDEKQITQIFTVMAYEDINAEGEVIKHAKA